MFVLRLSHCGTFPWMPHSARSVARHGADVADWTWTGLDSSNSYCTFVWLHPSADRGQRAVVSSSFRAQEAARLRFLALI